MAQKASTAPTGVSITRNKLSFTVKWKLGEKKYDKGQEMQYCLETRYMSGNNTTWKFQNWINVAIGKTATQKTITLNQANYYPYAQNKPMVKTLRVRVRGQIKGKKMSAWKVKDYVIDLPNKPTSVSYTLDSTSENKGSFTWDCNSISDTSTHHCYNVGVWTALIENFTGKDTDIDAKSGLYRVMTSSTSGTWDVPSEKVTVQDGHSYRRICAIYAQGIRGNSVSVRTGHTYGFCNMPVFTSDPICTQYGSGVYVRASWKVTQNIKNPIDTMAVQYAIDTPDKGLTCPDGASWNTARTIEWASESNTIDFHTDVAVTEDKCMWLRIAATHDKDTVYSEERVIDYGAMKAPTLNSAGVTGNTLTVNFTQNTSVGDAKVAVAFRKGASAFQTIGVFDDDGSKDITCPNVGSGESYQVQLTAFQTQSTVTSSKNADGVTVYTYIPTMKSEAVVSAVGTLSQPPADLAGEGTSTGTLLTWTNKWAEADSVTIAWADHEDALTSTEEPETYEIDHLVNSWTVGGLDSDSTYWFWVKLRNTSGDSEISSNWSDPIKVSIADTPVTPSIAINNQYVNMDGMISVTVGYSGNDATVRIMEIFGEDDYFVFGTDLSLTIDEINNLYEKAERSDKKWTEDSSHTIKAQVTNSAGDKSAESDTVVVNVIAKPTIAVITSTLTDTTITDDEGNTYTEKTMTAFPLTVAISGAGEGGTSEVILKRDENYDLANPSEQNERHYKDEILADLEESGDAEFEITMAYLLHQIFDGAMYRIECMVTDKYGQTSTAEVKFRASFAHQPEVPTATVLADSIARITVDKPAGYVEGDTYDIYRLTADLPEKIVENGAYGTTWVDPYPSFGETGGYRVVNKTSIGDYYTSDNVPAWTDYLTNISSKGAVIDFDDQQIILTSNVDLDNSWEKDFERTSYLGGEVQGDWNPAVTRDLDLSAVHVTLCKTDDVAAMRKLAVWNGICHIRTKDGSSFACDIQVKESRDHDSKFQTSYKLSISKVDSEKLDGVTLAEWMADHEGSMDLTTVASIQKYTVEVIEQLTVEVLENGLE